MSGPHTETGPAALPTDTVIHLAYMSLGRHANVDVGGVFMCRICRVPDCPAWRESRATLHGANALDSENDQARSAQAIQDLRREGTGSPAPGIQGSL